MLKLWFFYSSKNQWEPSWGIYPSIVKLPPLQKATCCTYICTHLRCCNYKIRIVLRVFCQYALRTMVRCQSLLSYLWCAISTILVLFLRSFWYFLTRCPFDATTMAHHSQMSTSTGSSALICTRLSSVLTRVVFDVIVFQFSPRSFSWFFDCAPAGGGREAHLVPLEVRNLFEPRLKNPEKWKWRTVTSPWYT